MAKDANFITYGKGPQVEDTIWFAPLGTVIETDPFQVPSTDAIGLGYVSDEGDVETPGYGDPEAQYDQNGSPVIYSDGDYEPSVTASLLQAGNDFEVDQVIYGKDNVIGTQDSYQINKSSANKSIGVIVIDHEFKNKARERTIYPNATIKLSDDITNTYTDLRMLPITITPAMDTETGFIGQTYKKAYQEETEVQG